MRAGPIAPAGRSGRWPRLDRATVEQLRSSCLPRGDQLRDVQLDNVEEPQTRNDLISALRLLCENGIRDLVPAREPRPPRSCPSVSNVGHRQTENDQLSEQEDIATRCARIALAVVGHGDLASAIAEVQRLPSRLEARGILAAGLLEAAVRQDAMADARKFRGVDVLLEIAVGPEPPTPQWIRTRTAAEVTSLMRGLAERDRTDFSAVRDRLGQLWAGCGEDPTLKPLFDSAHLGIEAGRSLVEGDGGAVFRFPGAVQEMLAGMPMHDPRVQPIGAWLTAAADLMNANQRGEGLEEALHRVAAATQDLPPGDLRGVADQYLGTLSTLAPLQGGTDGQRVTDTALARLRAEAERQSLGEPDRALVYTAVAQAALGPGGRETDMERVEVAIDYLRRAADLAPSFPPAQHTLYLTGLALGLYRRSELTNATADLREAQALVSQARTLAGGPGHPQWHMINQMSADLGRLLGEEAAPHRSAVAGLRANAWQVLIQPDMASATAAVRDAAAASLAAAHDCLGAMDPESAVAALDAGRGLALFAATEIATIGDRLTTAGEADLAARWQAAVDTRNAARLTPDLRRDVLAALGRHDSTATFLDPPGIQQIQRALVDLDADALVYLVSGQGVQPGYLLAVPSAGPVSFVALPRLRLDDERDVERYRGALARRDLATVRGVLPTQLARDIAAEFGHHDEAKDGADPDTVSAAQVGAAGLAASVAAICNWAWRSAMGPLIDTYLPRLPRPAGRVRRVVLVPMGELARIPWQAALSRDGRRALAEIAISQTPSARMLCRSAERPPLPPSADGLLVSDPDPTRPLPAARLETFALHRVLYRGARLMGRRPDGSTSASGAGTAQQVRDWLVDKGLAAGTLLHLACHGFVHTSGTQPTASLLLADGERLTAQELVTHMDPKRDISLVVLSACSTGLSVSGYDEAYSLGTAFLAGGARSVLSTQWAVYDDATAGLMYQFHRNLRVERMPVWAALRQAQLWMLDPDRELPADMPGPLRSRLASTELADVVNWAAFVHWGQ